VRSQNTQNLFQTPNPYILHGNCPLQRVGTVGSHSNHAGHRYRPESGLAIYIGGCHLTEYTVHLPALLPAVTVPKPVQLTPASYKLPSFQTSPHYTITPR
jgi:hypothetical protein